MKKPSEYVYKNVSRKESFNVNLSHRENKGLGYLQRHYTRTADGKIAEAVYEIFEEPVLCNPTLDKPTLEKPTLELPSQYLRLNQWKDITVEVRVS